MAALGLPLVAGAGWIAFSSNDALGDMQLAAIKGDVTILRGSETIPVDGTVDLQARDLIRTANGATARFNLEGDRSVEIAPVSQVRVLGASAVEVAGGSVLADAGHQLRVKIGDLTASGTSALFRVDRTRSARAGVYEGKVSLSAPGQPTLQNIGALFQASVPLAALDIPSTPDPYTIDGSDRWDETQLSEVIELDRQLSQVTNGINQQLGAQNVGLAYFRELARSNVAFMKPYLRQHRPADLMVGVAVAKSVKGPLPAAFLSGIDLFGRGAQWSVAAAIMGAKPVAVTKSLDSLIARSGLSGKGGGPIADSFAESGTSGSGVGPSDGPGDQRGGGGNPPPRDDDPTDPPPTDPTDPPDDPKDPKKPKNPPAECTNEVECAIDDLDPPVEDPLEQDIGKQVGSIKDSTLPDLP